MTHNQNGNPFEKEIATSRGKATRWLAIAIIAILVFVCLATTVVQATFAIGNLNTALNGSDDTVASDGNEDIGGDGTVIDNTNGAYNDGSATVAANNTEVSSLVNGNIGLHYKWKEYYFHANAWAYNDENKKAAWQVERDSNDLPVLDTRATKDSNEFTLSGTAANMETQWRNIIKYAKGKASNSPAAYKQSVTYHNLIWSGDQVVDSVVVSGGNYTSNKYVHVKLMNDWKASYTITKTGKEEKSSNSVYPAGFPYKSFTNTRQEVVDYDNDPFLYGSINIPQGVYIVLDLNGFTIDRDMYSLLNTYINTYKRYGFEYGMVFNVQAAARLEIYDSTATENADISRVNKSSAKSKYRDDRYTYDSNMGPTEYTTNHKGTVKGGMADPRGSGWWNCSKGGAIHLNPHSDLIIHSGTFTGNMSLYGGVIYNLYISSLILYDGYFVGNYAQLGGVFYECTNCLSADSIYGGVYAYNNAYGYGGAFALASYAYVHIMGGNIQYNTSLTQGGGICINDRCQGVLRNTVIANNIAYDRGGGIYKSTGGMLKFAGALKVYNNKKRVTTTSSGTTTVTDEYIQNVYLPANSTIPIGGMLLDNGDVAYIGITLASGTGEFTSNYGGAGNRTAPYNYFFSDNSAYGVNSTSTSGTITSSTECTIGSVQATSTNLYWVVKGYHMSYGNTLKSYTMPTTATNTTSDKITRNNVSAQFNYKVFRVTRVEAHSGSATGTTVGSWEINTSSGAITPTHMSASYKFKTGTGAATASQIQGVGATNYKGLEYAGSYSFLVESSNRYTNPGFSINILQTGIRFEIDKYKSGTKVDTLRYQGTAIEELGSTTAGKTGYQLGFYYSDSSLGTTANDFLNYGGIRTSIKYGASADTAVAVSEVKNAGTYHLALSFTSQSTGSLGIDPVANNYTFDGSTSFVISKQRVKVANGSGDYNGKAQKAVTFTANNTTESTALPTSSDYNIYSDSAGTTALTTQNASTYENVYVKMTSSNFEIVNASGTVVTVSPKVSVTINPVKVTISWGTSEFTYDGIGHVPKAEVTNIKNTTDKVTLTVSGGQSSVTNSGLATVTAVSNTNYTITGVSASELTCPFVIKPRPVTISWDKTEFTYNGAEQVPVPTITNLVTSGSTKDNVSARVRSFSSVDASGSAYSVSVIELTGDEQAVNNYTLVGGTNLSASYYINARTLDIAWENLNFTYDGTAKTPVATLSNLCDIDKETATRVYLEISVDGIAINAADNYKAIVELRGTHWGNYSLPKMDEEELAMNHFKLFNVKPLPIEVEWDETTHVYTGSPWSPTPTVTNVKGTDIVTATVDKKETNAGRYTVRVASVNNSNYTVTGGKDISEDYEITAAKLKDLVSWPEEEYIFQYDGRTQWYPVPVIKTHANDNVELVYTGKSVNAGDYVLRVTGYTSINANNYSFDAATDVLEQPYTVKPIIAEFDWGTAEERTRTYSRSVLQPNNVKITNLVTGDACNIVFQGGQTNAGADIPITIVRLTNDNYTIAMPEDAEGYEEYVANLSSTFTILPKPLNVKWDEKKTFAYDGEEHVLGASLTGVTEGDRGIITGDVCGIIYDENSRKVNHGDYFATIIGLTNPNYKVANGDDEGRLSEMFTIEQAKVTVTWNYTGAMKYNGTEQSVEATASGLFGEDKVTFIYEDASAKDAGSYTAKVIGIANEADSNYTVDVEAIPTCAWEIEAIDITVEMKSVDRVVPLPTDGSKIVITGWYSFTTSGLVGEDEGKQITSLFKVTDKITADQTADTALRLILVDSNSHVVADNNVTEAGDYVIRYQVLKANEILLDNDNYNVTVVDRSLGRYGVLHVTTDAVAGLTINEDSKYDFLYLYREDEEGEVYVYRRTYKQLGWTHGIDDAELNSETFAQDRYVIGNVAPNTSVNAFLANFSAEQRSQIRLYDATDYLIFENGQAGDGISDEELDDFESWAVGTGWRIEYNEEVIYVSVLGDVNGDGYIEAGDASDMSRYVTYELSMSEASTEQYLAMLIENYGDMEIVGIESGNLAALYRVIMFETEIDTFFVQE